jgi:hypothetical protein
MRRCMFARLARLLALAMLVACQSPVAAPTPTAMVPPSVTARAAPSATLTLAPSSTATPSQTATARTTFTPAPTDTQTPTPDPLAGAILKLSDLPAGFVALSDADRARLHFSDDEILRSYGKAFAAAQLHNLAGFVYAADPDFQIMLAYLFYPLSTLQRGTLDISLSDPALFQKAFVTGAGSAVGAAGAKITAKVLPGMNKFGDKSAGVAAILTTAEGLKLHLDIVVVRRGGVFEIYNSIYSDRTVPPATLTNMVQALDARVAAVVK